MITELYDALTAAGAPEDKARKAAEALAWKQSGGGFDLKYEKGAIELYKTIVSVQVHFNDLLIRTRWFGTTVIATIVGGSVVAFAQNAGAKIHVFGSQVHVAAVSLVFAIALLICLLLLDRYYYRLMIASIKYGESYEQDNKGSLRELGDAGGGLTTFLSQNISRTRAALTVWSFYGVQIAMIVALIVYIVLS